MWIISQIAYSFNAKYFDDHVIGCIILIQQLFVFILTVDRIQ